MIAPPISSDVDLRGLEYMPLFGNHLFGSEFNAAASDSEWRAAMTLWWAAWNQVPAGSLPEDDIALCRLADLGRDVKGWRKLKLRALHGFEKCSDGRLYHAFLCSQAVVAWDKRVKERERKAKWRADQEARKAGRDGDKRQLSTSQEQGQDATVPDSGVGDVPAEGKGRDVTGRDDVEKRDSEAIASGGSPPKSVDLIFGLGLPLLQAAAVPEKNARSMLGLMRKTHGDSALLAALQRMADERPIEPVSWLQANLRTSPPRATNGAKSFRERDAEMAGAEVAKWTGGRLGAKPVPQDIVEMEAASHGRLGND